MRQYTMNTHKKNLG